MIIYRNTTVAVLLLAVGVHAVPAAAACYPPPSGLLSWYRAEKTAVDAIGTNDGQLNNGVGFAKGMAGRAFNIALGSFVSAPNIPQLAFGNKSFSVELWVNFASITARAPFVAHDDGAFSTNKWIFWYDESGHDTPSGPALRFHTNGPEDGPRDPVFVPWSPVPDIWYHVAVTRNVKGKNRSDYVLYIDGVQQAATSPAGEVRVPSAPLTMGAAEGLFFNGLLDEISIYDRALTAREIQAIFNAGNKGKCAPGPLPLAASVTGMLPRGGKVTCQNLTTAQSIVIDIPKNVRSWDCIEGGLDINAGDDVRINLNVKGTAE